MSRWSCPLHPLVRRRRRSQGGTVSGDRDGTGTRGGLRRSRSTLRSDAGDRGGSARRGLVASACSDDDGGGAAAARSSGRRLWTADVGYSPERTSPPRATPRSTATRSRPAADLVPRPDGRGHGHPGRRGDSVYVGGLGWGVTAGPGERRGAWRFQTDEHRTSTPVRSFPAPRCRRRRRGIVFIGRARPFYALDPSSATTLAYEVGRGGQRRRAHRDRSPSPVVVGDTVIVGYDVHNTTGYRAAWWPSTPHRGAPLGLRPRCRGRPGRSRHGLCGRVVVTVGR